MGYMYRIIRQQMKPDAPGASEERERYRGIADQAVQEREERFGSLTPENAQAAMDWQAERIAELYEETR